MVDSSEMPEHWNVGINKIDEEDWISSARYWQQPRLSGAEYINEVLRELQAIEGVIDALLEHEANILMRSRYADIQIDLFSALDAWEICRFRDIIMDLEYARSIKAAKTPARAGMWGILKTSAVSTGVFKPEENKEVEKLPSDYFRKYEVHDGDLLINRANSEKLIGATVIVTNPPKGLIVSDKLWRIMPSVEKEANIFFLYALLNMPEIRKQIRRRASGALSSMLNISQERFLKITIPVPSEEIRGHFANKFRTFWDIINYYQLTSETRRDLLKTLLSRLFDGSLTITWWETQKQAG
ncbi:MAG TPA: restriction endonuclease subunit S [Ktedonosporobacter sp.]|nr:restriction endonuclease subunit S [Ktedonosporobacter sp.]